MTKLSSVYDVLTGRINCQLQLPAISARVQLETSSLTYSYSLIAGNKGTARQGIVLIICEFFSTPSKQNTDFGENRYIFSCTKPCMLS